MGPDQHVKKRREINSSAFLGMGIAFMGTGVVFMSAVNSGLGAAFIGLGIVYVIIAARKQQTRKHDEKKE